MSQGVKDAIDFWGSAFAPPGQPRKRKKRAKKSG
jgi:hypothetical protein